MKTTYHYQIELQLYQLQRLIEFNVLKFSDAYFVIFSDAPTFKFITEILNDSQIEMNESIRVYLKKQLVDL